MTAVATQLVFVLVQTEVRVGKECVETSFSSLAPQGSLRPILHISQPNPECIPPERLGLRSGKKVGHDLS